MLRVSFFVWKMVERFTVWIIKTLIKMGTEIIKCLFISFITRIKWQPLHLLAFSFNNLCNTTCNVTCQKNSLMNIFLSVCVVSVYIYPTPSPWAGSDIRSIFKLSKASLNSEFSYSWTGYLTKVKKPSLPYYFDLFGERTNRFMSFLKVLTWSEV